MNPRNNLNTLGTIACLETRKELGELCVSAHRMQEILEDDSLIVLPLNLDVVDGVAVGVSASDVPFTGSYCEAVIYVEKVVARQKLGAKRLGKHVLQSAVNALRTEVQEFSSYLSSGVQVSASSGSFAVSAST